MRAQHRATSEQWEEQLRWAHSNEADSSCIIELRDRIAALEERLTVEGPAVAEARGPGSVGDIVATEEELAQLYSSSTWHREALRAIYNLGRQHAAAAQSTLQNHP